MTPLAWAKWYREHGWSVFPCRPRDKRPLVDSWLPYQTELPTLLEIERWWGDTPTANLAIATGRGLLVVDLDGPGAEDALFVQAGVALPDDAPRVRTGNGEHVYLRVNRPVGNKAGIVVGHAGAGAKPPQVDLRGDGGYVLAPPSIHPSGAEYRWLIEWDGAPLPPAPPSLLEFIARKPAAAEGAKSGEGTDWFRRSWAGVAEGRRDNTCARMAGFLLHYQLPTDVVLAMLSDFAARCTPPLPPGDVQRIVRSVAQREATKRGASDGTAHREPTAEHIGQVMVRMVDALEQGPPPSTPTGFGGLSRMCSGGFHPGELIYLGARPGMGKTALALQVAREAAKAGRTVLFISREMVNLALARRLLAQAGRISARSLKTGKGVDMPAVNQVAEQLANLPIWLCEDAFSLDDVQAVMATVSQRIDLLIVDYLQLVRAPRHIQERRHQVESVSKGLKALAMTGGMSVLCLSSLSRPSEGKEREPRLADLRESGELEHDADIVLFLHREKNEVATRCIVAKNRDGECGDVDLLFRPEFVSFAEQVDPREYDDEAWPA